MAGLLPPHVRCTAWWYAAQQGMRVPDWAFLKDLGKRAAAVARDYQVPESKTQEGQYLVFQWPEWVWDLAWRKPESPVEQQFLDAHFLLALPALLGLLPQYELTWRRRRLDFAIPGMRGGFGVEIDGFKNHSTREDQTKDNRRQRDVNEDGIFLARYTGQEVYRGAEWCVRNAARLAGQWRRRLPDSS